MFAKILERKQGTNLLDNCSVVCICGKGTGEEGGVRFLYFTENNFGELTNKAE